MKIGDLSRDIGLSIQTIRFYEKEGLIGVPERTEGRFRLFSSAQRSRLILIKTLRTLGLPLEDVRSVISVCEGTAGDTAAVLAKVKSSVSWRRRQLDTLARVLDENATSEGLLEAERLFSSETSESPD